MVKTVTCYISLVFNYSFGFSQNLLFVCKKRNRSLDHKF